MKITDLNKKDLLLMVAENNIRAFDIFYELYYKQVFKIAYLFLKNTEMSLEVVSEVFFAVWKSRKKLGTIVSIEAYLYTVTKNAAYRFLANCRKQGEISIDEIPIQIECQDEENPQEQYITREIEALVEKAINTLPEKCRIIFLMSRNEGLKTKEIAKMMALSESTVRVQLKIAIDKIVSELKPYFPNLHLMSVLSILLTRF